MYILHTANADRNVTAEHIARKTVQSILWRDV